MVDKDNLKSILISRAQRLADACPDVQWVFDTGWGFKPCHSYHLQADDGIIFTIDMDSVWDDFKTLILAFENWSRIERLFLRAQRRLDKRVRKVVEKIENIPLEEKS